MKTTNLRVRPSFQSKCNANYSRIRNYHYLSTNYKNIFQGRRNFPCFQLVGPKCAAFQPNSAVSVLNVLYVLRKTDLLEIAKIIRPHREMTLMGMM